jgi:hypothetical protein
LDQNVTEAPRISHLAALPAIYTAAEYKWELDGQWWPIRIGERAHALDEAFPDATRFGMLSASNPGFLPRGDTENRIADRELQHALDQLGLHCRPGFAMARNRSWRAQNWLVIDPNEAAFDTLAHRFGQIGTLLWQRESPVRLRMCATRPATVTEHPHVDWIGDSGFCPQPVSIEAIPAGST